LPALHPSRNDCDQVDTTGLSWDVSTDLFKALLAEYLALTRDVLNTGEAIVVLEGTLSKRRARDAELGILSEFAQEERKVARLK
jgi:hypothetical protein